MIQKQRLSTYRPDWDKLLTLISTVDMKERAIEADGLLARVIQHEIDHLNGIYFFERLSSVRRTLSQKKLRRIAAGEIIANYSTVDVAGNERIVGPPQGGTDD